MRRSGDNPIVIRILCNEPLFSGALLFLKEEGSLYPCLHRMQRRGWLRADWGLSENNRKAKYYSLTAAGRRRLGLEEENWGIFTHAVAQVLGGEGA